jgi:hypothetical protein
MLIVMSATGNLPFSAIQPQKQRRRGQIIEKKTSKGQKSGERPLKKNSVGTWGFSGSGIFA